MAKQRSRKQPAASDLAEGGPDLGAGHDGAGRSEIELCFGLTAEAADALLAEFASTTQPFGPPREIASVYFDTPDFALHEKGMLLRNRRQGRTHLLGVKWKKDDAQLFARAEHEVPVKSGKPELSQLDRDVRDCLEKALDGAPLVEVFRTEVSRATCHVSAGGARIELALDRGRITGNEADEAICELELELKSGTPDALHAYAASLAARHELRLLPQSKSGRGYLLVGRRGAPVCKAGSNSLSQAETADDAIAALITACIGQFLGNWPAFLRDENPGAVHQMRVALRRLRALLRIVEKELGTTAFGGLRDEAKRIAGSMGDARNWDVLVPMLRQGPGAAFPDHDGMPALFAQVEAARSQSYDRVRALLDDPATARFVIDAAAMAYGRKWRDGVDADGLDRLTAPVRSFARDCLDRAQARVRKRGKGFRHHSPEQLHRLRIALKGLRYAADLFGPLFHETKRVKAFREVASTAQDVLGGAHDAAVLEGALGHLDETGAPQVAQEARGIALGWFARDLTVQGREVRRAWRRFKRLDPFW
jgi:inorganic triphosphatase YgiF